ncbi:hypothetical protein B0H34DRAFT_675936 [Crassisporium funariophilum]|nr:hypothetical protein B0H34DRAFT_675936 [Crassisporium funariophilum]
MFKLSVVLAAATLSTMHVNGQLIPVGGVCANASGPLPKESNVRITFARHARQYLLLHQFRSGNVSRALLLKGPFDRKLVVAPHMALVRLLLNVSSWVGVSGGGIAGPGAVIQGRAAALGFQTLHDARLDHVEAAAGGTCD